MQLDSQRNVAEFKVWQESQRSWIPNVAETTAKRDKQGSRIHNVAWGTSPMGPMGIGALWDDP